MDMLGHSKTMVGIENKAAVITAVFSFTVYDLRYTKLINVRSALASLVVSLDYDTLFF